MTRPKRSTKPAPAARRRPRAAARPVAILSRDIVRSRTLGKGKTWVVAAEVHVKAGVTLTVADGATILVANGVVPGSRIRRAALVFDPGSRLRARRLAVKACGSGHRPVSPGWQGEGQRTGGVPSTPVNSRSAQRGLTSPS